MLPTEILIFVAPVLALALLLLRDLPVLGILALLIVVRALVDGPFNISVGANPMSGILGLLVLGLGIASGLRSWRGFIPFLGVACLLYLSTRSALEIDPDAMNEYVRLLSVVAVFVIVANLRRQPNPRTVVLTIQMTSLVSAVTSLFQFATGGGLVVDGVLRATGTMAHPNSAALLYSIGATASLVAYFEIGRRRSDFLIAGTLFMALLSTGSVGGIVALASMLGAYAFLSPRVAKRARVAIAFIGAVAVIAFFFSPLGAERLSEFSDLDLSGGSGERNSLEWRLGRWQDILAYWQDSPITGVGYGGSAGGALLNGYPPHNEYVRVLVELGLVGAIVLLVILSRTISALRRVARSENSAASLATLSLALLMGMLVNALTENTFMYSVPGYLLALTIGSALWRGSNSQKPTSRNRIVNERTSHIA